MNRILATGPGSYQAARDINVINHFVKPNCPMAWVLGMVRAMHEPVIVFDAKLQIICTNNAWGTFDNFPFVKSLDDVISIVSSAYYNPDRMKEAVEISAQLMEPRNFVLHMVSGSDVVCRSHPVIDQGLLSGIIFTAWKQDSTIKQQATSMFTTIKT